MGKPESSANQPKVQRNSSPWRGHDKEGGGREDGKSKDKGNQGQWKPQRVSWSDKQEWGQGAQTEWYPNKSWNQGGWTSSRQSEGSWGKKKPSSRGCWACQTNNLPSDHDYRECDLTQELNRRKNRARSEAQRGQGQKSRRVMVHRDGARVSPWLKPTIGVSGPAGSKL